MLFFALVRDSTGNFPHPPKRLPHVTRIYGLFHLDQKGDSFPARPKFNLRVISLGRAA